MVVDVDMTGTSARVQLLEADDLKRFHIRAAASPEHPDPGALDAALRGGGVGWAEGEDAMVEVAWIRRVTAGRPESWRQDLEGMISYAISKGWASEDASAIQAHVEWHLGAR